MPRKDAVEEHFADMDGYFPGSSKKLGVKKTQLRKIPLDADYWKPDKTYVKDGKTIRLYTIGKLARELGRSTVSMRRWEKEGIIPRSGYRFAASDPRGRRRFYTRAQIDGIVKIAGEEGLLDDLTIAITHTNFALRVKELFERLEAENAHY